MKAYDDLLDAKAACRDTSYEIGLPFAVVYAEELPARWGYDALYAALPLEDAQLVGAHVLYEYDPAMQENS